jgi:hypothetical protein
VDYLFFPVVCSGLPLYIMVILNTMVMKNSALHIICPTPNPSPNQPPFPGNDPNKPRKTPRFSTYKEVLNMSHDYQNNPIYRQKSIPKT